MFEAVRSARRVAIAAATVVVVAALVLLFQGGDEPRPFTTDRPGRWPFHGVFEPSPFTIDHPGHWLGEEAALARHDDPLSARTILADASPCEEAPRRRVFVISYVGGTVKNVGLMYGALTRSCWARMHGYYAVLYNDADLVGFIPHSDLLRGGNGRLRGLMYSKNFLIRRTMLQFNLTERDWVFWLDSDTVITNPAISLDVMLRRARTQHMPNGSFALAPEEPSLLVSNSFDGINAGVVAVRASPWGRRFLQRWWEDANSTEHSWDNGPLIHAVLRAVAEDAGLTYKGECHMATNPEATKWDGFRTCYIRYLANVVCKGAPMNCVSRCPRSDAHPPFGDIQDPREVWGAGRRVGSDFELGFLTEFLGRNVRGTCHMNPGLDWRPCALWTDKHWLLHLAGTSDSLRARVIPEYALRFRHRYSPRCF